MGNKRVDLYSEVHKGIRRELCNWVGRFGRLNVENASDVAESRQEFSVLMSLLKSHAKHEEAWVHPLLNACVPEMSADLEREHGEHEARLAGVAAIFDRLFAGGSDDPWAMQQDLYRQFANFNGHYLVHMAREENEAMAALHEKHSDEELLNVTQQLRAAVAPEEMGIFMSIMIPAMNLDERGLMFGDLKENAPEEVFSGMCGLASNVLDADEWAAVCDRVEI